MQFFSRVIICQRLLQYFLSRQFQCFQLYFTTSKVHHCTHNFYSNIITIFVCLLFFLLNTFKSHQKSICITSRLNSKRHSTEMLIRKFQQVVETQLIHFYLSFLSKNEMHLKIETKTLETQHEFSIYDDNFTSKNIHNVFYKQTNNKYNMVSAFFFCLFP